MIDELLVNYKIIIKIKLNVGWKVKEHASHLFGICEPSLLFTLLFQPKRIN